MQAELEQCKGVLTETQLHLKESKKSLKQSADAQQLASRELVELRAKADELLQSRTSLLQETESLQKRNGLLEAQNAELADHLQSVARED